MIHQEHMSLCPYQLGVHIKQALRKNNMDMCFTDMKRKADIFGRKHCLFLSRNFNKFILNKPKDLLLYSWTRIIFYKYFPLNMMMESRTLLCIIDDLSLPLSQVDWTLDRTFERSLAIFLLGFHW